MASKFARGLLAFVGGALAGTGEGMRENALARLKGVEAKKGRGFNLHFKNSGLLLVTSKVSPHSLIASCFNLSQAGLRR